MGGRAGEGARQDHEREFPVIDRHATVLVHFEVWGADKKSARGGKRSAPICGYLTVTSRLFARQGEYRQRSAQRGIGRQARIAADGAEARGVDGLVLGRQLALVDGAMPGGGG